MNESFGTRLRLRREQQQVSITAIASQTKINPTLLRGLEQDDLSQWPEGIFRRAYIRAYAAAIGLDPDETTQEFLQLHPDSVVVLPAGAAAWPGEVAERQRPPAGQRLGRLVTTAIAAVPAMLRRPRQDAAGVVAVVAASEQPSPSLAAIARLCTQLARVTGRDEAGVLMADAATLLEAVGVVAWSANASGTSLIPALMHGYGPRARARLTTMSIQADNAVGAAFRASAVCVVEGDGVTGAVAVPMLGPSRCVGVLALELPHGIERRESSLAIATIVAAQLVSAPWLQWSGAQGRAVR